MATPPYLLGFEVAPPFDHARKPARDYRKATCKPDYLCCISHRHLFANKGAVIFNTDPCENTVLPLSLSYLIKPLKNGFAARAHHGQTYSRLFLGYVPRPVSVQAHRVEQDNDECNSVAVLSEHMGKRNCREFAEISDKRKCGPHRSHNGAIYIHIEKINCKKTMLSRAENARCSWPEEKSSPKGGSRTSLP